MSNEDVLMQFTAEEDVSTIIEAMEESVTAALDSITQAMDDLDLGLSNLSSTADTVSLAFGDLDDAFTTAESSATSFQSSLDNIDSGNISDVASDMQDLSGEIQNAEGELDNLSNSISNIDGTTITLDVETSGLGGEGGEWDADAELGGELTGQDTSALRTSMYDDIVGMSSSIKDVGTQAVESASAAEQGWLRFGNAARTSGFDWENLQDQVKDTVKAYSDEMGRGVADTRTAMTTYMNMGMTLAESQEAMKATSNYATQFGITQAEASKMIQMSFMGAGRSIKKLGLDIKDFKDEAGNVDREKLLQAIMEKTDGAADKYANSYEARVQRMNNAINSLRTDFGKEIINTIEPLLPVVQQLFQAFSNLPGPVKTGILAFGGLAGGAAIVAGPLIKMRAYMKMAGVEMGTLSKGMGALKAGFKALSGGEGIGGALSAIKNFSVGNTSAVAKATTTVVEDAGIVAAEAPAAEAAAAGTTATGGALSGIATAFTSMIVPLIAIAAVIAVMIPIIAGLAAEALIFIKGIQLLIDALDFDSIDLTGAIEGIKQIGRALLEVGVAMGEMTFANIMTGLAVLTTGIPGLINPIQIAGQMLIQAAQELEVFNSVQIDPAIPKNIKSISNALKVVSDAMTSLTNVVVNMAIGNLATLGGLLGNVSDAITTAKNEITHAADEIATLKDLPDIDQGAVDRLEKVSSSLESVAKAMDALRSLRDDHNWDTIVGDFIQGIFGGVDIQQALLSVKDDLYKAASSLSVFKDMANVPEGVGKKLKATADALKSVAESIETLRGLRDDYNWDSSMGNIFQGVDIPTVMNNLRGTLYKVAASLRSLNDISAIPEGTAGKIKKVTSTTKTVIKSIDTLKDLNSSVTGTVNLDNVVKNVDSANKVLRQVASRLRSLSTIANVPEGVGAKIKTISSTTKSLKGSITAMNNVPQVNDGTAERVKKAVSSVKKVAKQLNRLENTNVSGGIGQILQSVNDALSQLKTSLSSASGGFKSSGVSIGNNIRSGINQGMSNLSGTVRSRVSSATGSGASAAWTGGARMGNSATRGFQSAFKIADIASSEVSFATQAIQNGTSAFVQAVGSMAEQAVQEAKSKLDQHSPGRIARMWGDEMGYSKQLVLNKGQGLVSGIRDITSGAVNAGQGSINMGSAFTTDFDYARLNAVNTMGQGSNMGSSNGSVTINFAEGAVKLDAHNMTTKECRQIMINAMDGLSDGNYRIDVKGA